ncbi:hypothetical protein H310_01843 [Aphanomyces invadans]|uniref:Uncharacterized protein n=1 Tax=Aphanomyces invadans TaxID=157072 RepID=A0A024UN58_9STRA|nr:hypothetical protein H310_01843 [Aphanomyces invadans]ETW07287.1 hypothetical protein H310_01843 [Aphanomyces invadans]|eukprot:XP_008863380.1 hypothetical protein H310_01843 [Aphanomyces invadans]
MILQHAQHQHASKSTIMHALFVATSRSDRFVEFYCVNLIAFLDECKNAFEVHVKTYIKTYISVSTISGVSTMPTGFFDELASIDWSNHNVQFLDEVSFDSRGMLRKRGYAMKGQKLCFRGEFNRKPRVSLLCFIDVHGVTDVFGAVGAFDRHAFVK